MPGMIESDHAMLGYWERLECLWCCYMRVLYHSILPILPYNTSILPILPYDTSILSLYCLYYLRILGDDGTLYYSIMYSIGLVWNWTIAYKIGLYNLSTGT